MSVAYLALQSYATTAMRANGTSATGAKYKKKLSNAFGLASLKKDKHQEVVCECILCKKQLQKTSILNINRHFQYLYLKYLCILILMFAGILCSLRISGI